MSKVVIENTKPRLHHLGEDVRLLPGRNEVDVDVWAKWRSHAIVQAHIRYGDFIEVDVKALDAPPVAEKPTSAGVAEVVEPEDSQKKKKRR